MSDAANIGRWLAGGLSGADITVLTALRMEAAAITRALRSAGLSSVLVQAIGLRACRLGEISLPSTAHTIIVAGLAGGLDPALRVGDVVVDFFSAESPFVGARRGKIYTSDAIVSTVDRKAELFGKTGAAAVDMEQAIIARWAATRGARVIGLRAISDGAGDILDPVLLTVIDPLGRPRPVALAGAMLRRPKRVIHLLRLARRSRFALRQLSAAAVELVRSLD